MIPRFRTIEGWHSHSHVGAWLQVSADRSHHGSIDSAADDYARSSNHRLPKEVLLYVNESSFYVTDRPQDALRVVGSTISNSQEIPYLPD